MLPTSSKSFTRLIACSIASYAKMQSTDYIINQNQIALENIHTLMSDIHSLTTDIAVTTKVQGETLKNITGTMQDTQ